MSNPYRGKRAIERGGRRTVLVFCGLLLLVLAAAALAKEELIRYKNALKSRAKR